MSNKSPWVKAKERLPEFLKEVVVTFNNLDAGIGWFSSHKDWEDGDETIFFRPKNSDNEDTGLDSCEIEWLDESLLESPARYSEEELKLKISVIISSETSGNYKRDEILKLIQSLPSNAETVEKKEEVNEWLKKNWPEGKFRAFIEFMKTDRLFFVDEVRKWLNAFLKEEISFSKFVELFNEKVFEKYPASPSPAVSAPVEKKGIDLKAMEEKLNTALEKETPESLNEWLSLQEGQERAKEWVETMAVNYVTEKHHKESGEPWYDEDEAEKKSFIAGFAASKDYAKGLLEWVGKSYENIEDIVDKPALWKEVGFGADLSHYTTSQLIDLYDEHLKHLNQQK
jgi:hypothetical protein